MKLQASAPSLSQSSSGPDSCPASPLGAAPGSAPVTFPKWSSMFWTIDSKSGFGLISLFWTAQNIGFLLLRRRASCRMPVRAAGTEMRSSRVARESAAGAWVGDAVATAAWGPGVTAPVMLM